MKSLVKIAIVTAILLFGVATVFSASDVAAQSDVIQDAVNDIGGSNARPLTGVIKTLIDVFLFIIGALSVIMIIYGGFRYVTSAGDTSAVSSAKNTILYAVIGLIIAVAAYALADFVVDAVSGTSANIPSDCTELQSGGVEEC